MKAATPREPISSNEFPDNDASGRGLSLGVLVCTYRRPNHLARCLKALDVQTRLPEEVIVVSRVDDAMTAAYLRDRPPTALCIRIVAVTGPGVVCSRNAGLDGCCTDILAQIDDDTAPHADWCTRIVDCFAADPLLGGLGGRDRVYDGHCFDETQARRVGILQWHGRAIGNHHRGFGPRRAVHFLKGANMSFRASAVAGLRFDARLRGTGAEPHEDMAFSLAVRRRGWILLYDPAIVVDHYTARAELRPYSSVAFVGDAQACRDSAFNMVVALWNELSLARKLVFAAWSVLIGTGPEPGLIQAIRYTPKAGLGAWQRFWITQQGKLTALVVLTRATARRPNVHGGRPSTPGRIGLQ